MKVKVDNQEVDLLINGQPAQVLAKKVRLTDHGLDPDEVVRKHKEAKAKQEAKNEQG